MTLLRLLPLAALVLPGMALAAPTLKPVVSIASDVVTVGDLIDDAGAAAREPLFRSPDLGTTGSVSTAQILRRARALGVEGVRTSGVTEVVVSRPARTISQADVVKALAEEIGRSANIDPATLDISLDQPLPSTQVSGLSDLPVRVLDAGYLASAGRFDATVALDIGGRMQQLKLRGNATEMADILVLARTMQKGEIVDRDAIMTQRMPRRQAARMGRIMTEEVIGQAARKQLRAGQPVQPGDLGPPILIAKGDRVTIQLTMPGVTLSLRGVAQEAGGKGDQVGVLNENSKRVVQGTVAASGLVTISNMPTTTAIAKAEQ